MRVYNLTTKDMEYRKKRIPPNGGFKDFPGLTFISDRDRALEKAGVIAFGSLPKYWKPKKSVPVKVVAPVEKKQESAKASIVEVLTDKTVTEEELSFSYKKEKKKKWE